MVIVEFKDAVYSKAFELLDDAVDHVKSTKMVLCALEDALYECYDASSSESEEEYDSEESSEYGDDSEMNLRRGRRSAMRYRNEDNDYRSMNSRRSMRSRRTRMGNRY